MNRIKKIRINKEFTQQEVADYLGVTRQAISLYELDKRNPKDSEWEKLAKLFTVSVPYLKGE